MNVQIFDLYFKPEKCGLPFGAGKPAIADAVLYRIIPSAPNRTQRKQ